MVLQKVAYIVWEGWREVKSGVATFIRLIEPLSTRSDIDFLIVEGHRIETPAATPQECATESGNGSSEDTTRHREKRRVRWRSLRLLAGYLKMLIGDIRRLRGLRSSLKGRILVTNEFGCETLPIAMRVVFPRAHIIAIVHTHPGMLSKADNFVRKSVERLCALSVSEVVFNSESLRVTWQSKVRRLPKRQSVIPHGIPDPILQVPADYPPKDDKRCVDFVCVARFVYWKGHAELLRAWKSAVESSRCRMRLILVGDGDELDSCRSFVQENCLEERVFFMGARPGGDCWFNGGDVGILLSIEPEAFGLVLLEAMSRAKPVIASNMGGFVEIVKDGETGILVDPQSAEDVARSIVALAEDESLRQRMGAAARARWQQHYRAERMLEDYIRVFSRSGA